MNTHKLKQLTNNVNMNNISVNQQTDTIFADSNNRLQNFSLLYSLTITLCETINICLHSVGNGNFAVSENEQTLHVGTIYSFVNEERTGAVIRNAKEGNKDFISDCNHVDSIVTDDSEGI